MDERIVEEDVKRATDSVPSAAPATRSLPDILLCDLGVRGPITWLLHQRATNVYVAARWLKAGGHVGPRPRCMHRVAKHAPALCLFRSFHRRG